MGERILLRFFSKNIENGAPFLYNNSNYTKLKVGTPCGYYIWKKDGFQVKFKNKF